MDGGADWGHCLYHVGEWPFILPAASAAAPDRNRKYFEGRKNTIIATRKETGGQPGPVGRRRKRTQPSCPRLARRPWWHPQQCKILLQPYARNHYAEP